jgi:hypothetical protein
MLHEFQRECRISGMVRTLWCIFRCFISVLTHVSSETDTSLTTPYRQRQRFISCYRFLCGFVDTQYISIPDHIATMFVFK